MITQSKTLAYLHSLNNAEKAALLDYLSSPFFNKRKELLLLCKELLKEKLPSEEKLYEKLSGKAYEEQKLRYLLSDLNLLIEDFFVQRKWKQEDTLKKQRLIESLQEKKLLKYIPQHLQELIAGAERTTLQDGDYLGTRLHLEEAAFRFASLHDNRSVDSRLQTLSDSIDTYYFAKKLKYACEMLNRSNVLQVQYQIPFIQEIKTFLPDSGFLKVPVVAIYFHILNSLMEPDEEQHYRQMKKALVAGKSAFSPAELRDMFTFAQNYCIRQLNSGKAAYLDELFANYEFLLEEKILLAQEQLSQFDFKNIVTIALRLHKYDWTRLFISRYLSYLPVADRQNAEVYNLSRLYYSGGDPRRARKLMQDVEFTDIYYHLDAKALLVKIYYDTNAFESLIPLMSSFGNYLKRNKKVSAYQRLTYQNFLKLVLRMFNYKLFDKGKLEQISLALSEHQQIADINWLKQKMEELA
ncbi:MAG: hypothetical protein K0S33_2914 [Bacteroidetes bacterium]|jgi:hypothetical protein|nr:hypothetical protein [Bacteroidota bacterium]